MVHESADLLKHYMKCGLISMRLTPIQFVRKKGSFEQRPWRLPGDVEFHHQGFCQTNANEFDNAGRNAEYSVEQRIPEIGVTDSHSIMVLSNGSIFSLSSFFKDDPSAVNNRNKYELSFYENSSDINLPLQLKVMEEK